MNCKVCYEAVKHPICTECLEKEIESWMVETNPELVSELRMKTYEIKDFNFTSGINCLLCKQDIDICSYCYSEHIINWLLHHKACWSFAKLFNTHLVRSGFALPKWEISLKNKVKLKPIR